MADVREEEKAKSLPDLLWDLANRIFKREAIMLLVVLLVGGGSALYARAWATEQQKMLVDAGVSPLARELKEHIEDSKQVHARQEVGQQRTEAKVDRLDARMEQLMIAIYETKGRAPPPAPELVMPPAPDAGRWP